MWIVACLSVSTLVQDYLACISIFRFCCYCSRGLVFLGAAQDLCHVDDFRRPIIGYMCNFRPKFFIILCSFLSSWDIFLVCNMWKVVAIHVSCSWHSCVCGGSCVVAKCLLHESTKVPHDIFFLFTDDNFPRPSQAIERTGAIPWPRRGGPGVPASSCDRPMYMAQR